MKTNTETYYILSDRNRTSAIDEQFETRENAHDAMLKIQVRQKENGYTPDTFIIVQVTISKTVDDAGVFVSMTQAEKRV